MIKTTQSQLLFSLLMGSAMLVSNQTCIAQNERKPNIIIILGDDLGNADVGYHKQQSQIPTPNIDALAGEGVIFTSGYVTAPVSAPSRAALLTGRYQQSFGFEDNPGPFRSGADIEPGIPVDVKTIAEYLKPCGYATGCLGKWHLGGEENDAFLPNNRGFNEFFGFLGGAATYFPEDNDNEKLFRNTTPVLSEPLYMTDALGREAIDFITRHREEPFFLYLAFNAVHGPLQAPQELINKFSDVQPLKRRKLCAMQYSMDQNIGRVMEQLKKLGLDEQTLVIFLSDNGGKINGNYSYNTPYRGEKGTLFEGGVRLPFCMKWPGHIEAGSQYDNFISSMDILPTILGVVDENLNEESDIDGVDLMPFLNGKKRGAPHDLLFWRMNSVKWAVRDSLWKLVYSPRDKKSLLFNICDDICEKHDLSQMHPKQVNRLKKKYDQWAARMEKPKWGWQQSVGKYVKHVSENFENIVKLHFKSRDEVKVQVVDNPLKGGINTSNTVLKIEVPAGFSSRVAAESEVPRFNKRYKYAHIKVLFKSGSKLRMGVGFKKKSMFSMGHNNSINPGVWIDMVFDFKNYKGVINKINLCPCVTKQCSSVVYVDDIEFNDDPNPRDF